MAGLADELTREGLPCSARRLRELGWRDRRRWARALASGTGSPFRARARSTIRGARAFLDAARGAVRDQGRRPRRRQGRHHRREPRQRREAAIRAMPRRGAFGAAGRTIVIEEFLPGGRSRALALTDGERVTPLALAQDYKRIGDGDTGPNTGGMGAHSPSRSWIKTTERAIVRDLLRADRRGLRDEGVVYRGVPVRGPDADGGGPQGPRVQRAVRRPGDPGAAAPAGGRSREGPARLRGGELAPGGISWSTEACVGVVLASAGYPRRPEPATPSRAGLRPPRSTASRSSIRAPPGETGRVVTAGGRVLTVAALGPDVEAARGLAYEAAGKIRFEGMQVRRDIAMDAGTG